MKNTVIVIQNNGYMMKLSRCIQIVQLQGARKQCNLFRDLYETIRIAQGSAVNLKI